MKARIILLGSIIAATIVACTQEDALNYSNYLQTLSAEVEDRVDTRVGFTSDKAEFFWTTGDQIGVTVTDEKGTTIQSMTLNGEGGEASGTFTGEFNGTIEGFAVYPYNSEHSFCNNTLTYVLPNSYFYGELDYNYADPDGNSTNAPMWAKIVNGSAYFQHLGGVFAIEVRNLPANASELRYYLRAENQINGSFTTDLSVECPVIKTSSVPESNDAYIIKETIGIFSTGENQTSGHIYIPLPTGNLGTLTLDITAAGGRTIAHKEWNDFNVNRKNIKRTIIECQSIDDGNSEVKQVNSISEVDGVLFTNKENLTVQVTGTVAGNDNMIHIPDGLFTATTTISLASVEKNTCIYIVDKNRRYNGQIIIDIPVETKIGSLIASIPNGEVYVRQGCITDLTVSSADNTTIIGAGVTVDRLVVEKGNIKIKNGGVVTAIQRSKENTDKCYVFYEGDIPDVNNTDENIIYVNASDLQSAINSGYANLSEDIRITKYLTVVNNATINLNGYSITRDNGTALYVTNGNTIISGDGGILANEAVWAAGGEVTIENGWYRMTNDNESFPLIYSTGGTINIKGGSFSANIPDDTDFSASQYNLLNIKDNSGGQIIVTGGMFHNFNPANNYSEGKNTSFVPDGYIVINADTQEQETEAYDVVSDNDIWYRVVPDYSVLLQNAINAGNITLTESAEITKYLTVVNNATINLNGYSITRDNGTALYVTNGNTIISGDGGILANEAVWAAGGEVTIEDGWYHMTNNNESFPLIYSTGGTINIKGGSFSANIPDDTDFSASQYNLLNIKDNSGGQIIVTGGMFHNFNPANNYSEGNNTSFVPKGYVVINTNTNKVATDAHDVNSNEDIWYRVVPDYTALLQSNINKGYVELSEDIMIDNQLEVNNNATIDLNECTIIRENGIALYVAKGSATITGHGRILANQAVVAAGGEVTIEDGSYRMINESQNYPLICSEGGKINIEGGSFFAAVHDDKSYNLLAGSKENIIVTGGEFRNFNPANIDGEGTSYVSEGYMVINTYANTVATDAHDVNSNEDIWYRVIPDYADQLQDALNKGTGTVTLTLTNQIEIIEPLTVNSDAILNFNGGSIINNNGIALYVAEGSTTITGHGRILANQAVVAAGGEVTIEDGSYRMINESQNYPLICSKGGKINIEGGSFFAAVHDGNSYNLLAGSKENIIVTGGEFRNFNPANIDGEGTSYVSEGYMVINTYANTVATDAHDVNSNEDIWYRVIPDYADQLQDALNKGTGTVTLTLTNQIEIIEPLTVNSDAILNFNGGSIINNNGIALYVAKGSTTITGHGRILANQAVVAAGGEVTIEDGSYRMINASKNYPLICSTGGKINIKGGSFFAAAHDGKSYNLLSVKDGSSGSIIVTGGEFRNFNPANDGKGTSYVPKGYVVINANTNTVATAAHDVNANEEIFYVVIPDYAAQLKEGGTINLTECVEINEPITISKNTTINLNQGEIINLIGAALHVTEENTSLIIDGDGAIVGNPSVLAESGEVTIKNGYYIMTNENKTNNPLIKSTGGKINIIGGVFAADFHDGKSYNLLLAESKDNIIVTGGEFRNFNPANIDGSGTSYVLEGYMVILRGDESMKKIDSMHDVTGKDQFYQVVKCS